MNIRKIDEGFTNFDKEGTPETNKNYGKLEAIDNIHRNILLQVYGESNYRGQKIKNKSVEESISFLNYVKEKFSQEKHRTLQFLSGVFLSHVIPVKQNNYYLIYLNLFQILPHP